MQPGLALGGPDGEGQQRGGHAPGRGEGAQRGPPVQHRGVEDEAADAVAESGVDGRVQGHRGAGRPAVQDDVLRAVAHGVADGSVEVAPFGLAEVGEAVRERGASGSPR